MPKLIANSALPHDIEAQEAILAACMTTPSAVARLAEITNPGHFWGPDHQQIFSAILDLWGRSQPINHLTVARQLGQSLEEIGGMSALLRMMQAAIPGTDGEFWAHRVAELAQRRAIIETGMALAESAWNDGVAPPAVLDQAHDSLLRLTTRREKSASATWSEVVQGDGFDLKSLWSDIEGFLESPSVADQETGIPTGFSLIDNVGGLPITGLVTVLGDTGAGKSFFVQWLSWQLWRRGVSVHLVTTEMSRREVSRRLVFMGAGVDPDGVRQRAGANDAEREAVRAAINGVAEGPRLVITDVGRIPLPALVTEVQRQHRQHGTQVVIVDHIQHVTVPGLRAGDITGRVDEVVGSLKGLAMNDNLAVMAVSHITREATKGPLGKHSGKGGGSIEQDSNQMLTLTPVHWVVNEWEPFVSEQDIKAFKGAHGYLHVRIDVSKNRAGSEPWDIRTLDFRQGGRWVVPEQGMQWA